MVKERPKNTDKPLVIDSTERDLILHNDEYNTFEFVISTLIEVCAHSQEQAEQCTLIAHSKGKCCIKRGDYSLLSTLHKEMSVRGLTTSIE